MCKNAKGEYIIIMMCKIMKHPKLMLRDTIWKGQRKSKYFGVYFFFGKVFWCIYIIENTLKKHGHTLSHVLYKDLFYNKYHL